MKKWMISLSIVLIYLLMQFGSIPVHILLTKYFNMNQNMELDLARIHAFAWALFLVNALAAPLIFFFTTRNRSYWSIFKKEGSSSIGKIILWGVLGFFMALVGQMIAGIIEVALGIQVGSENTMMLANIAQTAPIIIISIVLFAPFLEEIVFRRVIFGGIYTKTNFWIAALASSVIFAVVHGELQHTLIYMAPGFVFAFIYTHTKSIITPMIAHLLMNGFVTIVQLNQDKLLELQNMQQTFVHLLSLLR